MDKAWAYGIQGKGTLLVRAVRGNYDNVVGLPVAELMRRLSSL
jgi:septum formation protein